MNDKQSIVKKLVEIVGEENVLTEKCDLICYSRDRYPPLVFPKNFVIPLAVVRPVTTSEVQKIVKLANKKSIPLVPRGGGTSFSGSAAAIENGIIIDLTRMNHIIDIDEDEMHAKVQAGVVIQNLEEKLNQKGLTLGHDPGSFPSATVGGSIATNALGWRAGKYGEMARLVLGLEVVLPTGIVIKTRYMPKSSTGFNVKGLFIGSEGTLGIITEAILQVSPSPEKRTLLFYAFSNFQKAQKSLIKILKTGLTPTTMLVVDEEGVKEFTKDEEKAPKAGLILGYEGLKEEVEAEAERSVKILEEEGGINLGENAAQNFWLSRHDMYSIMNLGGTYDNIDTAVPVKKSVEYYEYLKSWSKKYKVKSLGISSWMLPQNVSIDLVFDESFPEKVEEYLKVRDEAVKKALQLDGTLSYCIGIGIRYPHLMKEEHRSALEVMRVVKKALDPKNIMNPGRMGL
ncbi:MAG: FAD-binding oxidoreductase [Candidatus Bathyarchaeales archaeon]